MLSYQKRMSNCLVSSLYHNQLRCNHATVERVKKLQDENDNLSRHTSASSCRRGPDSNDDDDDDESESVKEQHMQLILDLSEKVGSFIDCCMVSCKS